MKLYKTSDALILENEGQTRTFPGADWDAWLNLPNLRDALREKWAEGETSGSADELSAGSLLPPLGRQEVWAAGVTYYRSRTARIEESKEAGGGSFYDRVYDAERPELFLKATPERVVGPEDEIRIRGDSHWNVPEPELALVVNARGEIVGYTIGNDVSSRDIEGENPLYLPQAKFYDGGCAVGPCVLVADGPLPPETEIQLQISRDSTEVFQGTTSISQIKRPLEELVEYLYRETSFPHGAVLLTGTGIIPEDAFTLERGDEVRITIPPIGTLVNPVARS